MTRKDKQKGAVGVTRRKKMRKSSEIVSSAPNGRCDPHHEHLLCVLPTSVSMASGKLLLGGQFKNRT